MNSIVKDIQRNCPECECDTEKTIQFLERRGDIHFTSDHYREIWFFYVELFGSLKNKEEARNTTLELFKIKHDKFKYIQKWAKRSKVTSFT